MIPLNYSWHFLTHTCYTFCNLNFAFSYFLSLQSSSILLQFIYIKFYTSYYQKCLFRVNGQKHTSTINCTLFLPKLIVEVCFDHPYFINLPTKMLYFLSWKMFLFLKSEVKNTPKLSCFSSFTPQLSRIWVSYLNYHKLSIETHLNY